MFRPQFHPFYNPRFNQRSPHAKPRGPFLRRNFTANQFRPPGPPTMQINYEFWCETCDKGFQTLQILDHHKSQHQKCNIDGCQFVAHPKVITKHIQMQHSTGLYKKIANLNNPEDIQKWREERKRRYPTKENIEKKAVEIAEKLERGEKMGIKFGQNSKRHNQGQPTRAKQHFGKGKTLEQHNNFRLRHESNFKPPAPKRICKTKSIKKDICKLQSFGGIQHIIIDDQDNEEEPELDHDSLIEDDVLNEDLSINPKIPSQLEPSVCGALSSLICNYGSSDEDITPGKFCFNNANKSLSDDHAITEENKITGETIKPDIKKKGDLYDDDSGPEEVVIKKEPLESNILINNTSMTMKTIKSVKNNVLNLRQSKKAKNHLPSTLLVKLLSKEIKQERNIILQCVRHVVKNNFFDSQKK